MKYCPECGAPKIRAVLSSAALQTLHDGVQKLPIGPAVVAGLRIESLARLREAITQLVCDVVIADRKDQV